MSMKSLSQRSSVTTQDAHLCSTQQPGDLTEAVASATDHVSSPSVSDVCQFCMESCACDDLNCIKCHSCGVPTHTLCLIKFARDKSAKKFQGAAPSWLYDLLHAAGLRFYCQVCQVTSQTTVSCSSTHTAPPTKPKNMQSSINCIESKIDLLFSGLLDQPASPIANLGSSKISNTVQSFADAAKSNTSHSQSNFSPLLQPISNINSIVNEAVSNAFRNKAIVEKVQATIVVFGLAEKNNDKVDIKNMLDSVCNSYHISKIRRLGKLNNQTNIKNTASPNSSDSPPRMSDLY